MPVTYRFDFDAGYVRTRCFGPVTFVEVVDHFRELVDDPQCPACLDVLLDLCDMTSLPESVQLRSVASEMAQVQERVEWGAVAIVSSRDALFGMTRMFGVFAERIFSATNVVRDLESAEAWLAKAKVGDLGRDPTGGAKHDS
jgi:hypothetical protein